MAQELVRIGYWRGRDPHETGADPTLLVDSAWAPCERDMLAAYLRAGVEWTHYMGVSYCRFACGIPDDEMGSRDLTDGTWLWPEGLSHYVTEHQVCLPDQFLNHARHRRFRLVASEVDLTPYYLDVAAIRRGERHAISSKLWDHWATERGAVR